MVRAMLQAAMDTSQAHRQLCLFADVVARTDEGTAAEIREAAAVMRDCTQGLVDIYDFIETTRARVADE